MEESGENFTRQVDLTPAKESEIELEDLPLKINILDATSQKDTIKFLCNIYPNFEITESIEETDLYYIYSPVTNKHVKMLKENK